MATYQIERGGRVIWTGKAVSASNALNIMATQAGWESYRHSLQAMGWDGTDVTVTELDDASDEDERTERRREYHDDIRADFRRLGLL